MALGAFLAGLLLAETEFSLQVQSDIAPYRSLLLGLFFMTVGMSVDPKLLVSNFPVVVGSLGLLLVGKSLLVALIGKLSGISIISAIRVGLLLAPGEELAFVAFGEAVNQVGFFINYNVGKLLVCYTIRSYTIYLYIYVHLFIFSS
ncbi:PREDICTED: K(+) efflux antiporter 1, chloroplastic-like, partial [Fragaria vesca subsp. vesca]